MMRSIVIIIIILIAVKIVIKETFNVVDIVCMKPLYDEELWNHKKFKKNNNFYNYARNQPDSTLTKKRYPAKGIVKRDFNNYTCKYFDYLLHEDNPKIYKTSKQMPCKCDEYKIALALDDNSTPYLNEKDDFHFYRQDFDTNIWSHKRGGSNVSRKDASGKLIYDPELADRNYKKHDKTKYNYRKFCGFYCLPYNDKKYIKATSEI